MKSILSRFLSTLLLTILSTSSAVSLSPPISKTADKLFFGGTILTMNPAQAEAEAMAVQNGFILAVGTRADVEKYKVPTTQLIDLQGKTLMPGFIEPHGHPFDGAFAQFYAVDIRPFTVKSMTEIVAKINAAVAQAKPGDYVMLNGLDLLLQKDATTPTLQQMDGWAPKNPLLIINNSGHAAYANSLAYQGAGITAQTPDPPGGRFLKTSDGKLSGTVMELPAMSILLSPMLTTVTPAKMLALLNTYYQYLASNGITASSDMTFDADSLPAYQAMAKDPNVPIRIRLYEMARKDNQGTLPPMGGDDLVRQNGIKWWADGSPWLGTIAISQPYLNDPLTEKTMGLSPNHVGPLNYKNTPELQAWVEAYYQQGYQIAIHTEGDLAIGQALDVMEAAAKKFPARDHRMRLEHVPLITESELQRVKRLGMPVSFLMAHIYYWGDLLPQMFGNPRAGNWNRVASAQKLGIPYTFHNDGPVTPASPLMDFQIAVTRKTKGGTILGPDQRVPLEDALRARTIHAAHELFMEKQAGSLEVGKWADLVLLSADPRKVAPETISQIKVEATFLKGKQVWPPNPTKTAAQAPIR